MRSGAGAVTPPGAQSRNCHRNQTGGRDARRGPELSHGKPLAPRARMQRRVRALAIDPPHRVPIEDMPRQRTEDDDVGNPLIRGQAERHLEWHPIPDKIQTVDQVGVPGKFPAEVSIASRSSRSSADATASRPSSPSLETAASI
jgi:hypothetical protein